ncbi:MAG: RNA polymerase sigma factor [Bryobacterales bacterium]|nr:RNA polymerase sigma factor [Bryobacteraceae bacterium]MDW8130787.1 RNA polymerase sigma factor [Bryobacterales bacterium]
MSLRQPVASETKGRNLARAVFEARPPQAGVAQPSDCAAEVVECYEAEASGLYRYATLVLGSSQAAEDVLQDTFLRLFAALRSGTEIRDRKAWLFRVLRNACLERRRNLRWKNEVELPAEVAMPGASPEADYHRRHLAWQLARVLSPRELECVRLRAEGLSYAQIANVLRVRSGTVGALLSRALAKCRSLVAR